MQKGCSFSARLVLTIITILIGSITRSQTIPAPKIMTPNAASLDKFGDVPVDLSTGVPDISIPIHTLKFGNISVPISLRYHSGSVRVAQHPGWVGMGWDLESIGSITRRVNWIPDEAAPTDWIGSTVTYYPEPPGSPASTCGADIVNKAFFWSTLAQFQTYYSPNAQGAMVDVGADEFDFNFPGYSGKFFYEGTALGWQVICDQPVKVENLTGPDPRMSQDQAFGEVVNYPKINNQNGPLNAGGSVIQPFAGFKLTTPDGIQYFFGQGLTNGVEFSGNYAGAAHFAANTWLLCKIIDTDGNEVDFHYSGSYPVVDLSFGVSGNSWTNCQETYNGLSWLPFLSMPGYSSSSQSYGALVNVGAHGGNIQLPMYLDAITCKNETVSFSRSTTNPCLRYSDDMLTYLNLLNKNPADPTTKFDLTILGDGLFANGTQIIGINQIQWQQLNFITITNGNGQAYRQFEFNYSSVATQRLTLQSLLEQDGQGNNIGKYSFGYGPAIPPNALYDGDYADHWGFYNGKSLSGVSSSLSDAFPGSIFDTKRPDPTLASYGLLTSISYPTGGHTNLTWEAHDYSQLVSADRSTLSSKTGFAGGARIKEVQSTLSDGSQALDKKFFYVKGYTAAGGSSGLSSSGILNGTPTYFMNLNDIPGMQRLSLFKGLDENIQVVSLNSYGNYSYNSEGSYIGYDEVAEVDADGSYTIHYFTNYDADINGTGHGDQFPDGMVGWLPGDLYFPMSTLEVERGKPAGESKYTASDVLMQRSVFTYRHDQSRMNNFAKLLTVSGAFSGCGAFDALVLATATRKFSYVYYKIGDLVTTYDQLGNNPLTISTSYEYNTNNLLSKKTETNSKGETIQTLYAYPTDFPTDPTSQQMVAVNILNWIVQQTTTNISTGNLVSSTRTFYYSPQPGMYKPQSLQIQIGANAPETRQQFYQYDSYGNIEEMSKTNDIHEVYLWGYFGQYPVAKIVGSNLNTVLGILGGQAAIDAVTNSATATSDLALHNLLQTLRTSPQLSNALVTTYTYLPLTGVSSETDPRGQTSYYQYDAFQRLKMIKDNDGNVLKTFNYQYQIPQ